MKDYSIGWKCPVCAVFVDMGGRVHLHEEKPFLPPQTRADRIRSMSDEALADLFVKLMSKQRAAIIEQLHAKGVIADLCIVEMPAMAKMAHLKWLREPAEEE